MTPELAALMDKLVDPLPGMLDELDSIADMLGDEAQALADDDATDERPSSRDLIEGFAFELRMALEALRERLSL